MSVPEVVLIPTRRTRGFTATAPVPATSSAATESSSKLCVDNKEKIDTEDTGAPLQKKAKLLVERLGGILSCVVCLDTPSCAIYQCTNGHLICAGCYNHIVADARLGTDEEAKCPACRVEFCTASPSRNLAVEKALSELPAACMFCQEEFPRHSITTHEEKECSKRLVGCKYGKIGCPWQGPEYSKSEHEESCNYPQRSGADIMDNLQAMSETRQENQLVADHMIDLMSSYEKIAFNDLQLQPYRTQSYFYKVLHETPRFNAFPHQWVVRARILVEDAKKPPSEVYDRRFMYQVVLMSHLKPAQTISCQYMIVRGPFSDIKVTPKLYKYDFTEKESESPYQEIPLRDSNECNRLLAKKFINFRLVMFAVLP